MSSTATEPIESTAGPAAQSLPVPPRLVRSDPPAIASPSAVGSVRVRCTYASPPAPPSSPLDSVLHRLTDMRTRDQLRPALSYMGIDALTSAHPATTDLPVPSDFCGRCHAETSRSTVFGRNRKHATQPYASQPSGHKPDGGNLTAATLDTDATRECARRLCFVRCGCRTLRSSTTHDSRRSSDARLTCRANGAEDVADLSYSRVFEPQAAVPSEPTFRCESHLVTRSWRSSITEQRECLPPLILCRTCRGLREGLRRYLVLRPFLSPRRLTFIGSIRTGEAFAKSRDMYDERIKRWKHLVHR